MRKNWLEELPHSSTKNIKQRTMKDQWEGLGFLIALIIKMQLTCFLMWQNTGYCKKGCMLWMGRSTLVKGIAGGDSWWKDFSHLYIALIIIRVITGNYSKTMVFKISLTSFALVMI